MQRHMQSALQRMPTAQGSRLAAKLADSINELCRTGCVRRAHAAAEQQQGPALKVKLNDARFHKVLTKLREADGQLAADLLVDTKITGLKTQISRLKYRLRVNEDYTWYQYAQHDVRTMLEHAEQSLYDAAEARGEEPRSISRTDLWAAEVARSDDLRRRICNLSSVGSSRQAGAKISEVYDSMTQRMHDLKRFSRGAVGTLILPSPLNSEEHAQVLAHVAQHFHVKVTVVRGIA